MRSQFIRDLCAEASRSEDSSDHSPSVQSEKTATAQSLLEEIDAALGNSEASAKTARAGKVALAKLLAAGDLLRRGGAYADDQNRG